MNIALSIQDNLMTSVRVFTRFHPIYSVREHCVTGLEALSRGYAGISAEEISPAELFRRAEENGRLTQLDRHALTTAVASYASLPEGSHEAPLLFLNISTGMIERGYDDIRLLNETILKAGVSPDQVVLEIIESRIENIDALSFFVQYHRAKGFLIALDDVGAGHSNLERISLLKPDIIKIDRSLVSGINRGYHKQEVCKALILLSHRIGALTIAEGIEEKDEALTCLELGVDMLQGFYFCRPLSLAEYPDMDHRSILELADTYARHSIERKEQERQLAETHRALALRLAERLMVKERHEFSGILKSSLRSTRFARCAYILDATGHQITGTIVQKGFTKKQHRLFAPAPEGTDHSLKPYVLRRGELESCYITEPYISKATGDLCITASLGFRGTAGEEYILCIDIDHSSCRS
jgi:EAL domain-containing protein (putative c-di-GMP-specific phosphodiesterase class I)